MELFVGPFRGLWKVFSLWLASRKIQFRFGTTANATERIPFFFGSYFVIRNLYQIVVECLKLVKRPYNMVNVNSLKSILSINYVFSGSQYIYKKNLVHLSGQTSNTLHVVGRDSSVGIATGYGLDGPGIESRWGRDITHLSRPALGPTSPPVHGYRAFPGGKERLGRDAVSSPPPSVVVKKG